MKIVGERLENEIVSKGWNKSKFARKSGLDRTLISQLCNDNYKHEVSNTVLEIICNTLNVSPEYLTGESEYKNTSDEISAMFNKIADAETRSRYVERLLSELGIIEFVEVEKEEKKLKCVRLWGGEGEFSDQNGDQYLDMNEVEYKSFRYYLLNQIRDICKNYVEISLARENYSVPEFDENSFEDL